MTTSVTIGRLFDLYISAQSGYHSQATRERTYEVTKRLVVGLLGDVDAVKLTPLDLLTFVRNAQEKRKPNSVNVALRAMRAVGRFAIRQGVLPAGHPLAEVPLLRVREKPVEFFTKEQFRDIYQKLPNDTFRRLVLAALYTGLRLSDIVSLDWSALDRLKPGAWVLRLSNQKTGKVQVVPVAPDLQRLFILMGVQESGPIWGREYSGSYVSHIFKQACKDAKVPWGRFHLIRHTTASWLVQQSVPLFDVQKLLNHSSPQVTMRYAQLQPNRLADTVSLLMPVTGSAVPDEGEDHPTK